MTADHPPEERPDDEPGGRTPERSDAEVDRLFAELITGWGQTAGASDRVRPGDGGPSTRPTPERRSAPDLASPLGPADAPDDGPQPLSWPTRPTDDRADDGAGNGAADRPLRARPVPPTPDVPPSTAEERVEPAPASSRRTPTSPRPGLGEEPYERYRPELVPLGRPRWPIVVGWSAMSAAVILTLLAVFGLQLPTWVGWLAVGGFLGGFGLLVAQLPRHRPPDAGDGAVL